VARGEVFPFVLRGRDLGTVVDVSPGGVHRAEWEAFVMRNLGQFGSAMPVKGAVIDPRDYVAGKRPFGTMNAWGNRGVVFEAFLAHLAAKTGDPRVAAPDVVLGELGGPMTSGYGRGDQQAIRSQAAMDEMNRQIGFRPREPAAQADGGDGAVASRSRHDAEDSDSDSSSDSDVIEARSLVASKKKATPQAAANPQDEVLALLEQHKFGGEAVETIRELAKHDSVGVMAVLHAETPEATRAALESLRQRLVLRYMPADEAAMRVARLDYANAVLGPRFRVEIAHRKALAAGGYADDPSLSVAVNRWLNESAVLRFLYTADRPLFDSMIAKFGSRAGKGGKFRKERFEAYVMRAVTSPAFTAAAPLLAYHLALVDRHPAVARMAGANHLDPGTWPTAVRDPTPPHAIGPVVADPGQVPPGLRVDHVGGRRGTVIKVENGVAQVHFDGDPDDQLHPVAIAAGGLRRSHDPNPKFGDPPPFRDEADAAKGYAGLDAHRKKAGYQPYRRSGDDTVAMVQLNGMSFHGTNSRLDPSNYALPVEARRRLFDRLKAEFGLSAANLGEAKFISHAEGEALIRAFAHFGELPEVVEIYVDRETCKSCAGNLQRIAQLLGVKELRIYQMDGRNNPIVMR
jgi:hypothetical protein